MGQPAVMMPKLIWDSIVNHCAQTMLFIHGKFGDYEFMKSVDDDIDRSYRLAMNMQKLFRDWRELEKEPRQFQGGIGFKPLIHATFAVARPFDEDGLRGELRFEREQAEAMAVAIFHHAADAVLDEKPDPERPINPYVVSMHPDRWEKDGLYDEENGMTLEQTLESTSFVGGPPRRIGGGAGGPPAGIGRPTAGVGRPTTRVGGHQAASPGGPPPERLPTRRTAGRLPTGRTAGGPPPGGPPPASDTQPQEVKVERSWRVSVRGGAAADRG